ncbi:acyl-CoA dehydrogenase family protein [Salinibacterium hongtaonis]|uniref:acyl-CoA dehydrogenase family protein n=1 Tax=Homoserinimonas hongtaonis TaxID=2079791 RepID=UPI000D338318|nr:acyl-CoA dehydrogenase family protein [Salinibacterium hongtaonis]AWB88511.1 acyl-CoA dehydrogenase [Salinibacterium hongtaonis]
MPVSPTPFPIADREAAHIATVRELATDIAAQAAERDDKAELPREALAALHEAGLNKAVLPANVGGEGLSYVAYGEIVRTLAEADPSVATIWTMHSGAGVGLSQLTAETKGSFYADEFLAGRHFANALSEPTSGNRFLNPQQAADEVEGGYQLDGAKRFVSGSEMADYLMVNVLVDDAPAFFAVKPDESVTIIPIWDTLGLRATRSQLLSFNKTLLRHEDRGRALGPGDFAAVPAGLPLISLGVADAALASIVDHTTNRMIMGKPLSHQQWVQFEVADVQSRLEAVRAYVFQTLWQADQGDYNALINLSRSKYLANKIAVEVAQLAVRIGGASGFLKSSPIQRHLRNAQAGQLMAYSTEVLAGEIGKHVLNVTEGA